MKEILYPVGRLVGGSIYRPQTATDNLGKPKPPKADPTKPEVKFSFGVAYAKNGSTHWAQTEWGAQIWAEGHAGFPNGEAGAPSFAWKITDGDSMIPNKRGNKPADQEGQPGHWIVWYSGSYAPKTCSADGKTEYRDAAERIKPGHFVQVFGTVKDNKPSQSPGVYMNFLMVAHAGFGPEIVSASSVDAAAVGFGATPLPAGASAVPLAASALPGAPAAPVVAPGVPGVSMAAPVTPSSVAVPSPIIPNPAILSVPMPTPARVMTARAGGHSYEAMRGAGWDDARLIAEGYMAA